MSVKTKEGFESGVFSFFLSFLFFFNTLLEVVPRNTSKISNHW